MREVKAGFGIFLASFVAKLADLLRTRGAGMQVDYLIYIKRYRDNRSLRKLTFLFPSQKNRRDV